MFIFQETYNPSGLVANLRLANASMDVLHCCPVQSQLLQHYLHRPVLHPFHLYLQPCGHLVQPSEHDVPQLSCLDYTYNMADNLRAILQCKVCRFLAGRSAGFYGASFQGFGIFFLFFHHKI